MEVPDVDILDRIERLALRAGAGEVQKKEHPLIVKLRVIGRTMSGNTGTALYGTPANIEWSEIISFANQE